MGLIKFDILFSSFDFKPTVNTNCMPLSTLITWTGQFELNVQINLNHKLLFIFILFFSFLEAIICNAIYLKKKKDINYELLDMNETVNT